MNNEVSEIKNRIKINDLISEYIKINKAGSSFVALCPFHNEKTPSFSISPQKGIFNCFGCGKNGDIFTFIQEYENISFQDSLKKLAEKAGVKLKKKRGLKPEEIIFKKKEKQEKERLLKILKDATVFFQINLLQNQKAKEYLKKRGLKEEIVKKFKLGFAEDSWDSLKKYLEKRGYIKEELLKVGLLKENEEKKKIYDKFRNRIIFPITNYEDNVIAYSGRDLSGNKKVAKYLNSPETIFFNKSDTLYGFSVAKNEARKIGYFIVVEGQMDLIMSHQAGFKNTVATSGTSLTEKHLNNLSYFSKKIIFAFDSDKAGIEAAFRGIKLALKNDFDVKILNIQKGKDPADIILESEKIWKKTVLDSRNFIDFYIDKILNTKESLKDKIKQMEEKILPFLVQIENPIEKGKYISKLSKGFDIKETFIEDELEKIKKEIEEQSKKKNKRINFKEKEKFLENTVFEKKDIKNIINKKIEWLLSIQLWNLKEKKDEQISARILLFTKNKEIKDFNKNFQKINKDKKLGLIKQIENLDYISKSIKSILEEIEDLEKDILNLIFRLKKENLKKEISDDKINSKKNKEILRNINILNKKK